MWTPRRLLLFMLALLGSAAVYFGYSRFYGGMDGLPVLPEAFLETDDDVPPPPQPEGVSVTVQRLIEAFGPNSPEVLDRVAYTLRLELRERGLVIASGQPVFRQEPSKFVTVSPFSIAFFGKAKPAHQLAPGEVQEISTFHAEKAVLEFDRPVTSAQDISSQAKGNAKLLGMELMSLPDMPSVDERRGYIEITNNQRTRDPSQMLVFRTIGPLFYVSPKPSPVKPSTDQQPEAPNVWTSAPVTIVDRKNLVRPLRSRAWNTAIVNGDDLRHPEAISNILLGNTLPPPTITAVGMKIYMTAEDGKPTEKRNSTGFSGVRMIELCEKVQFNLWTEGGGGFPGSNSSANEAPAPASVDPPENLLALAGGLSDALALARRYEDRSLLVVETLGQFTHDFQKNSATFEASTSVTPGVPNNVSVSRLSGSGRQDNLFCKTLVVDFADKASQPPPLSTSAPQPPQAVNTTPSEGLKIKGLLATGPHVYIGVQSEKLEAQCTELRYTTDAANRASTTRLRGTPVVTVRDRNRMMGGAEGVLGEINIVSVEPPPGSQEPKKTMLSVNSRGKLELFDEASNTNSLQAVWSKSLTQAREKVGHDEQDVLTFDGDAMFHDVQGGMKLSGDVLRLWLSNFNNNNSNKTPTAEKPDATPANTGQPLPQRVLAVGNVRGNSGDMVIEKTDQFTIWFRDVAPPPVELVKAEPIPLPKSGDAQASKGPPAATTIPGSGATSPVIPPPPVDTTSPKPTTPGAASTALAQTTPKRDEPKPKPPVKVQARVMESWVQRYALPVEPTTAPGKKAVKTTLKYEMERTRCDDNVIVHQDPADPAKNPKGLDIQGAKLNLDQSKAGSVMTVYGTPNAVAQVHFESISLFGPVVMIDQPNNAANVPGYGKLIMPANEQITRSDTPAGSPQPQQDGATEEPKKPSEMEITWTQSMNFQGAKAFAVFVGNVRVTQKPLKTEPLAVAPIVPVEARQAVGPLPPEPIQLTRVVCHRLDTTFDKPIYFNQMRSDQPKSKTVGLGPDGKPMPDASNEPAKLKTAVCTPISDTEAAGLPREKVFRGVLFLEETIDPTTGKYIKAQRIDAKMLELNNDPKGRVVLATGPGEVRILQESSNDPFSPTPASEAPKKDPKESPKDPNKREVKLTLVKFQTRMVAQETPTRYQEAKFSDGSQVWNIPTDNLNLQFYEHAAPKGTVYLSCADRLTVSSTPAKKPGQPPEQWMEALGNGEFENDDYRGTAGKIVYDGSKVIFEGSTERLARFYKRRVAINNQYHTSARRIEYFKDGNVRYLGTASGTIGSN